ncbi:hypothetical protein ALC57_06159 [Trachymyrmex cornetzi]|uniref:Uncharacterized protein n=1 Tax=Trachymyrmex cornetzi TaxID=471704 RepID=A0A151J974_9HYME|nr:hypothetical protein ALC57_06159 [Trachymyrmex cornetzi]
MNSHLKIVAIICFLLNYMLDLKTRIKWFSCNPLLKKQINSPSRVFLGFTKEKKLSVKLSLYSFHAFYDCIFCYEKQEKTGPRSRYFNILSERADERTAESTYQDARRAYEKKDESRED